MKIIFDFVNNDNQSEIENEIKENGIKLIKIVVPKMNINVYEIEVECSKEIFENYLSKVGYERKDFDEATYQLINDKYHFMH